MNMHPPGWKSCRRYWLRMSWSESSSGCVFWHTVVCMAQHRRTCLSACGRNLRSSVVTVSALLTPLHCGCRRLVGLPLATAPFWWLQYGHGTVCHRSGLLLTFDIPDQVSPFSSVIRLTWRCPLWRSADICVELCNSFRCKFCKMPPQLCDGSTIVLTFVVVVAVAVVCDREVELKYWLWMQVFLDALSHVIGQLQSKQLLMQHCRSDEQTGRLQLLGMLLGVNEWTRSFHARLTFPPSCVEDVAMEIENSVEVCIISYIYEYLSAGKHSACCGPKML